MVDIQNHIKQLSIRLNENISKKINIHKILLEKCSNSFVLKNPMIIYENKKLKIEELKENANRLLKQFVKESKV